MRLHLAPEPIALTLDVRILPPEPVRAGRIWWKGRMK